MGEFSHNSPFNKMTIYCHFIESRILGQLWENFLKGEFLENDEPAGVIY